MNGLTIPSISSVLRVDHPLEIADQSAASLASDASKDGHRIKHLLPQFVGKHLESKILVCETFNRQVLILVVENFMASHQVAEVRHAVERRFGSAMKIEIHPVTHRELVTYSKSHGDEQGAVRLVSSSYEKAFEDIVRFAVENRASDITLDISYGKPLSPITYKIDGHQIRLDDMQMKTERLEETVNIIWQAVAGGADSSFNNDVESQGIYTMLVDQRQFKLRFQSTIADAGPTISLRLLEQSSIKPLATYGYLPSHLNLLNRYKSSRSGFVVFSGRVDSGKTTSESALIAVLPKHYKVFMVQDPIEIIIDGIHQITMARPVDGSGDERFARVLMALKRSAPDVVSIGEVRDALSARAVADVGGMGILGLFTVHASSALHAPQKLWSDSVGVPRDFLSSPGMFKLFVHQALVPRLCSCANPMYSLVEHGGLDKDGDFQNGAYWHQYILRIEDAFKIDASNIRVRNHLGCEKCRRPYFNDLYGYAGRQLLAEMIEVNKHHELLRLISQGDALGMYLYSNTLKREPIAHPDMANKTIVECGLYHALQGTVDPRDIEQATEPFENLLIQPRYVGV